jgi:SAM-dependent methyltransferase
MQELTRREVPPADRPPLLSPLQLLSNGGQGIEIIEQWIRRKTNAHRPLRILEAGCGNRWALKLEGVPYTFTGVDVDERALEIRKASLREGDRVLYGDLRDKNLFDAGQFDVINNSFVLEHVDGAEQVLDNFRHWLAPGGLLVLKIPDRNSVYGFVTRRTPLWVHVLYKKYVCGMKNAGKPGFDPYPTFYDRVVSREGIHAYCRANGCKIRAEAGYANYLPRKPIVHALASAVVNVVGTLSFGKLDRRYNNLLFIIEK